jgi:hypothetical protein
LTVHQSTLSTTRAWLGLRPLEDCAIKHFK